MDLIRRTNDPFAGLTSLHGQLDDMFNNLFSAGWSGQGTPAMDVYTNDNKELVVEVQAPGFNKDDIELHVDDNALEIKGEKHEKIEDEGKKRNYMMRESHASFYRRVALPKAADTGKVQAHFDNGMLRVTVPFKELPKPARITISEGNSKSGKK